MSAAVPRLLCATCRFPIPAPFRLPLDALWFDTAHTTALPPADHGSRFDYLVAVYFTYRAGLPFPLLPFAVPIYAVLRFILRYCAMVFFAFCIPARAAFYRTACART